MTSPAQDRPTRKEVREDAELDLEQALGRVADALRGTDPALADKYIRAAQVNALSAIARALLVLGMDQEDRGTV